MSEVIAPLPVPRSAIRTPDSIGSPPDPEITSSFQVQASRVPSGDSATGAPPSKRK